MTDSIQKDGEKSQPPTGVLLQAKDLTVRTPAGTSGLTDISFHVEPGEVVALTDLGRSGKSTLLECLAGLIQPERGEVLIDGINLHTNLKAFRPIIGFVPAEFALHQNLTALETLQDAALLRLPRGTRTQDRQQRVISVINSVGLSPVADRQVGLLSNVDQRKLSIAIEMMGSPKLLLVDYPLKPLSSFEDVQITILLRELSRQGITIIQVNPRSRSTGVTDKIIFLAPKGFLGWFGPADETLNYLKNYLPRGVVKDLFGLQEALEMLVNPLETDGSEWAKKYKDHESYQKYVDDPLHNRYPDLLLQTRPLIRLRLRNSAGEKVPPTVIPRAGFVQKLMLFIRRNFRLLWRDRAWLAMLVIPLLVAIVHLLLSPRSAPSGQPVVFDLFTFLIVLTSAFLVQNEIFKEKAVFQREQRTSPILIPYIVSKLWLVALLSVYQGFVWAIIRTFGSAAGSQELLSSVITLSLVAFFGGVLGLIVSALSKRTMTSISWVLLLTVPLLLSFFNPLSSWLSLVIVSLLLIVLLLVIQNSAGSVRTS
ncbi:MAG TPA: ATP-binding cassette domain-containing protein [Anaerolineales bacterium]|nr:ATP-binding cassette domain-containing protein [Anaerolineales bacterium]